jgi:hypothetical protein
MFGRKKSNREDALVAVTHQISEALRQKLGDGWHFSLDRAFPCQAEPDSCSVGHHPAVCLIPMSGILKAEYQMDDTGQSAKRGPNMAVLYGHHSDELGLTNFFVHDIQDRASANPFLAYKSLVGNSSYPLILDRTIEKIRAHFADYLDA